MAVEFLGYYVDDIPLQKEMPDRLARKILQAEAEVYGLVLVEAEPDDSPAVKKWTSGQARKIA